MAKSWIGIDPGQRGFASVISDEEYNFLAFEDCSYSEIAEFLSQFSDTNSHIVIEDVHAIYGSSAGATFEFGKINGFLIGLLVALKIPYTLVPPKDWQNEVWINADKEYTIQKQKLKSGEERSVKKVETKATSLNAARRLFPTVDFRKSERAKKPHDGKVDALLMAEYGRRKNL